MKNQESNRLEAACNEVQECINAHIKMLDDEIKKAEVKCMKALAYKLNYYSIYHFLVFFFAHGIIFEEDLGIIHSQESKLKITEKVYSFARELLDIILEKGGDIVYHLNLYIACAVIMFSREYVLNSNSHN